MIPSIKTIIVMLITAIILSLLSVNTFAQETRVDLMLHDVNTNFNYGNSNSLLESYKKKAVGVQVGVSVQAGITSVFSIVPEVYFIMKGGVLKTHNPITVNESTLRLYEVELPVLARFHVGKFYINSGPYVAYTMSGRMKIKGSDNLPETSTAISFNNSTDAFKRWDMGVQAGAGYVFYHKKNRIALDLRYSYGLTNISQGVERYNRALNLGVVVSKKKNHS